MVPISVCIIAKNEEKYIEKCLQYLKPFDMEIIVTDTGSTDRTKDIAAQYGAKVYDFPWVNDFSKARNFCAEKASYNWILALDCDEYIQKFNEQQLRSCMEKYPVGIGRIVLKNAVYKQDGKVGYSCEEVPRFYNKKYCCFQYSIHESIALKPELSSEKLKTQETFQTSIEVMHVGYMVSDEILKAKQQRNLKLLYESLECEPERSAYTYFQIGQSEHAIGNYKAAVEGYSKCLKVENDIKLQYVQNCIIQLATAYAQLDEPVKAVEALEKYKDQIKTAPFLYTYGLALLGIEQPLKALLQLVLASMNPDTDKLGENIIYCYEHIIRLYQMFGQPQMAEPFKQKYEECLKERQQVFNQIEEYAKTC